MPRDGTKNLVPQNRRSKEEQRKIAAMGGVASGKARREKKDMMQTMKMLLDMAQNVGGEEMPGREAVCLKQILKAIDGDTKAAEYCRDTAGERAPDKVITAQVDPSVVADVESMVRGAIDEETSD